MYYDLMTIRIQDKEYVTHTSDSLIKRVATFYEEYGDPDKLMEAYYYMGRVYRDLHDAPEALKYFQKAVEVSKDTRRYLLLSKIYSQMGLLYEFQNVHRESFIMHKKSKRYAILAKDTVNWFYSSRDIARSYVDREKRDSALYYYKEAVELAKYSNVDSCYGTLTELGSLYRRYHLYDQALSCLYTSLNRYISLNNLSDFDIYTTYAGLGHTYLDLGILDSADYYLNKSVNSPNIYTKGGSFHSLSRLAELRHDYKQAVYYARRYQQARDSVDKITESEEIRRITAFYDYQNKEKDRLALQTKNDQMRIRIYQLLSILGLAIIMGLLLIYYFKKQKERSLKQLRIIKEEKEAQYRRSEQYIAENNRQIKDLEIKLLEEKNRKDSISQELIQVQKELLRVNNEQVQLQLVERDLQRTNMERSNVYIKFHTVCNTKQYLVTDEDWAVLQQELDAAYNGLTHRLYTMYPNLSLIELRICYLIKISIKVSDMASLLLRSKSSISSARTRLYKKFTGEEGTPEKLDRYIIDLK